MEKEVIFAGRLADLEDEGYFVAKLPTGEQVLVLRAAGVLHAIQRRCPHEAAPFERGQVWDGMIRCGQHGFTFNLKTGQGLNCSGYSIERYRVEQRGEELFISTRPLEREEEP